jgi:hypothetical protein
MILGIVGKKRSGKDEVADYLIDQFGFTRYKFADPIKTSVAEIFLWDDEWVNGKYKETIDPRWNISPRQAQQAMGTELFRQRLQEILPLFKELIGSDIWVKRFQYWYDSFTEKPNVVISDVRFLNEANTIKSMGGHIIKLEREGLISIDTHSSEMEIDSIVPDSVIYNDSTIAGLQSKIGMLYPRLAYGK